MAAVSSSSSSSWYRLPRVIPAPLSIVGGPRVRGCVLLVLALLFVLSWWTAAWFLLVEQQPQAHHQPHPRMEARHLDSDNDWLPYKLGRRISAKDAWLLEDWADYPRYRRAMMGGVMANMNAGGGGQPGSKPPPCHNQCPGCSPLYGQCVARPTYVPGSHGVGHAVWTCTCV